MQICHNVCQDRWHIILLAWHADILGPDECSNGVQSKVGKARSEGSASRGAGHRSRRSAVPPAASKEGNVKRSSILLRALSSSTIALLNNTAGQVAPPAPTPRSKCQPVCEGDASCEIDAPDDAAEPPALRAPPNSPAVVPRGVRPSNSSLSSS